MKYTHTHYTKPALYVCACHYEHLLATSVPHDKLVVDNDPDVPMPSIFDEGGDPNEAL